MALGTHCWPLLGSMSARLTSTFSARVSADSLKRKTVEAEKVAKRLAKKKGCTVVVKPEKREKELKKRKRQRTAQAEKSGNFLELAKKELRRNDKTVRNVKLLTQRRDLSGKAEDLMLSILGMDKPAHGDSRGRVGGSDDDDDGLFDF